MSMSVSSDPIRSLSDRQLNELLDGLSFSTPPAQLDSVGNAAGVDDTMPELSPIPVNAVASARSFLTNLSAITFSSRSHGSAGWSSIFSQPDISQTSRSDCSSWCLGRNSLHMALARGSPVQVVQDMLRQDKSITRLRDTDGLTPLHLACKRKAPVEDAVFAVLASDPEVSKWQDHFGRTPLHWAMKSGTSPEVIDALLVCNPGAIKVADRAGCLPLHCIEAQTPLLSIEKVLDKSPSVIKTKDFEQATPLHKLCRHIVEAGGIKSHIQTRLLLAMVGNPSQEERSGESPLSILMDDCVSKTNQFAEAVEMTFDLLALWCKQCAPLHQENIQKLTKLSQKLRDLNATVEELVCCSSTSDRDHSRTLFTRPLPAKRNRSNDSSKTEPTGKQQRIVRQSTKSEADCSSTFPDCSKNESATLTTALSTACAASSTTYSESCPNSSCYASAKSDQDGCEVSSLMTQQLQEFPVGPEVLDQTNQHFAGSAHPSLAKANQACNAICPPRPGLADDQPLRVSLSLPDSINPEDTPAEKPKPRVVTFEVSTTSASSPKPDAWTQSEKAVERYQKRIAREADVARKVDLIVELYQKEAGNSSMLKAAGPKRFMKRVVKISRCIHTCYRGNKEAFCEAHAKLDTARFKCPFNCNHWKRRGVNETDYLTLYPAKDASASTIK